MEEKRSVSSGDVQLQLVHTHFLHGKYLMVEVTLQLLVCQVDTKLLKTVVLKIFEPKDIENANMKMVQAVCGLQVAVEPRHNPLKHPSIECLCQCISGISCLRACVFLVNFFTYKGEKGCNLTIFCGHVCQYNYCTSCLSS